MDLLNNNIQYIKGVGPKTAEKLLKLKIKTALDLLYHFPRDYADRSAVKKVNQLKIGDKVSIYGEIMGPPKIVKNRKRMSILQYPFKDETGRAFLTFFNMPYLKKQLKEGTKLVVNGEVKKGLHGFELINPSFNNLLQETEEIEDSIVPIYPLTGGLNQHFFIKLQKHILSLASNVLEDFIPEDIKKNRRLCNLSFALKHIHFPGNERLLKISKYRLIFDEFFLLQLALAAIKGKVDKSKNATPFIVKKEFYKLTEQLPFKMTKAQSRTLDEIVKDLQKTTPMNRLVQGDVGSGKTIIALLALYLCVLNGHQGAMMVPTEILAEQHYETAIQILQPLGIRIGLLVGSLSKGKKDDLLEKIKGQEFDIVIGTHAIIQEGVMFNNLGLVITDEQHRFGVRQRLTLSSKGLNPHVLVMTATPIPRTLALILYGDMDISLIDELPPGRKEIKTYEIKEENKEKAYHFVAKQLKEGRQAYIVCPLVEDSEAIEAQSATDIANSLANTTLSMHSIALLHGKMKSQEKEKIMNAFKKGEIQVLVSTTVIEVGVNVPNATVMVIENAERFGLSQLHQLRGRVGRGSYQSYCVLIHNSKNRIAYERMKTMVNTNDGFVISEKDLALRGPGEFLGTRQHGLPEFKIANIFRHAKILKEAEEEVAKIVEKDPSMTLEEYPQLKKKLETMFMDFEGGFN